MNKKVAAAAVCLLILVSIVAGAWYYQGLSSTPASKDGKKPGGGGEKIPPVDASKLIGNLVLGEPTNDSITASIIAVKGTAAYIEYGVSSGAYPQRTGTVASAQGEPIVVTIDGLLPDTQYYYRSEVRQSGQSDFSPSAEHSFHTQRAAGGAFVFGVQGDSHPERAGKMFNPKLYNITMENVVKDRPDLYFMVGDDFSIENLIDSKTINQQKVDSVYLNQRQYVGRMATNTSLFLVNGNHEQAAKYLLDGTASNPAVYAGNARNELYPLPAPDGFYTGDAQTVQNIGLLRDYYAFEWGDALFVTIDPYWHSEVAVDNVAGGGGKRANMWDVTLGDEQYQWLRTTLEGSDARYKFIFTHHVLGTGRGGVEEARLYEWGGYNDKGTWEFDKERPGWEMPIHQLMVKTNVTIFFQGHDHLFAKQELDGVVYQSLPNPADDTYTAFNKDAYRSGDTLPNSGHLKVSVSSDKVRVEYVRSFLPGGGADGSIAYSYDVLP